MNLQEAIFRRNNLEERKRQLYSKLNKYKNLPYQIDGKDTDNSYEEKIVEDLLEEIKDIDREYLQYTEKINKANYENGILDKINQVKVLRDRINQYRYYLPGEYDETVVQVVEGVGVVKFSPIKEKQIAHELSELNKKVEDLSIEIDRLNQTTEI